MNSYESLNITLENKIAQIEINRPEKANSLHSTLWKEIKEAFLWADQTAEARVVILSGSGKHFCAGIDLNLFPEIFAQIDSKDEARKRENLRRMILNFQDSFNAIEKCRKPVIAAIQGSCIGGGVDMISACDLRYATQEANFSIKEIDIGMTADVGTLQRLPHLIGDGVMRELAYTGRKLLASEAKEVGLINRIFENKETMMNEVKKIAEEIASKSPLAIRGTKEMILYTRDHTVEEGLNYIATWNASMLLSNDLQEGISAQVEKRKPEFED